MKDDQLARVDRERAELIETVSRLRAERDEAKAAVMLAEATIDDIRAEREAARGELARLTAEINATAEMIGDQREGEYSNTSIANIVLGIPRRAALRQPAQAQYPLDDEPCENCVHGKKWHWNGGKCQNACPCEQYQPAPAGGEAK